MSKPPRSPLLLEPTADPAPPERRASGCAEATARAGPRSAMDLDAAELFVVATLRAWVAPMLRPGKPHPDWGELFRVAGVRAPAAVAFGTLMSIIAANAKRLIDVSCCRCPGLGEDETAMLRLVGALQSGETLAALEVLGDWLPGDAIRPALNAARRFALALTEAGLALPRRGQVIVLPPTRTLH